ncbi:hypothetical protein A1F99_133830 [Pyrenophora tritici-repentis]|nr:hypothetical protein A1F99_133830 [Pyrenophora tritici-repentis]
MGRAKRYNRDQLLDILENQCPEAFAKFPKADSFVFTNTDDVLVETKKGGPLKLGDKAWVEILGPCKPWLHVRTINGGYVHPASHRYVRCDGVFGTLMDTAEVYAWGDNMKTIVSFAFVYAGKRDTYGDFDNGNGLPILVKTLEDIAAYDEIIENKRNDSHLPIEEKEK